MSIDRSILREPTLALPIHYKASGKMYHPEKHLYKYEEILKKYSAPNYLIEKANQFWKGINQVYREYFLGKHNRAYVNFVETLEAQIEGIGLISSELPKIPFYKGRVNEGNLDFKDDEMFHIPYEKRGKVSTQRYSAPGMPCLYLGGSTYICWLELNRPHFDQFQVAMIWQKDQSKTYRLIDISMHPLKYIQVLENEEPRPGRRLTLEEYLQWWPVMAVCSIAVENENDTFKPEYVIPQFMLQYMLDKTKPEDYIGIKYLSVKAGRTSTKQYESMEKNYVNYAIPIREARPGKNFCSFLERVFAVAKNYSGKELQVLTDMFRDANGKTWGELMGEIPISEDVIYGTNGDSYPYSKSVFARIEAVLNSKEERISDDAVKFIPMTEKDIDEYLKSKIRVENETLIFG